MEEEFGLADTRGPGCGRGAMPRRALEVGEAHEARVARAAPRGFVSRFLRGPLRTAQASPQRRSLPVRNENSKMCDQP